jgi:uncharacterized protein (DUF1697 family)
MALSVFLRGVNVGGHKTFRPSVLAKELKAYGLVNIGAAGTFVVKNPVSRAKLRAEILRRLPFDAAVMICEGREILQMVSADPFAGEASGPQIARFVSVAAKSLKPLPYLPLNLPATGKWCLKVIAMRGSFVLGLYHREMLAIKLLSQLDKTIGMPLTTRNWNTMLAVARVLNT